MGLISMFESDEESSPVTVLLPLAKEGRREFTVVTDAGEDVEDGRRECTVVDVRGDEVVDIDIKRC